MKNAMGAAAGVAGGVLLADSLRGLFGGGHNAGSSLFGGSALGGGLAADWRNRTWRDRDGRRRDSREQLLRHGQGSGSPGFLEQQ